MQSFKRLRLSLVQLLLAEALFVDALPVLDTRQSGSSLLDIINQALDSVNATYNPDLNPSLLSNLLPSGGPYTITQNSPDPLLRATAITANRLTFLYGPPVAGGPSWPTGPLGLARAANDIADFQLELNPELTNTGLDGAQATADIAQYNGLQSLDDYVKLYSNEWKRTLPNGPDAGTLTNYTQDLLFSMQRLSMSPYQIVRLKPSQKPAFPVSSAIANKVCGMSQSALLKGGRLFYADYRNQANLQKTSRYAAASDSFFCIDKTSGNFLPLAIRVNNGKGPVFTPDDTPDDWLSAKLMYGVDDFWFSQWNHLANTHEVAQISYMAAIRTLSVEHPVQAILDRLMYEVFAVQPLAEAVLFAPGAAVDQVFPYTGSAAQAFSTAQYKKRGSGRFEANYFLTNLENRGLINSKVGPALSSFPFYEDASVIHAAQTKFMTSFVNSYYSSDSAVKADTEIQDWVTEARNAADAIDFPSITSRKDLINVLTHFAHIASTSHHTSNTNELLSIASVFPFTSAALYKEPPTKKPAGGTGVNPVEYLPPYVHVLDALTVAALFARPLLVGTERTLLNQFNDKSMLANMNSKTNQAANQFTSTMTAFSKVVAARGFDSNGLSQGMPFVWQALDPNVMPYSLTT